MGQLMWVIMDNTFRGQSSNGSVISVDEEAMRVAQSRAGKGVYDTEWWLETLSQVLERWGITGKRWMDEATRVPRLHFSYVQPPGGEQVSDAAGGSDFMTGPLMTRLLSGKLTGKDLPENEKDGR